MVGTAAERLWKTVGSMWNAFGLAIVQHVCLPTQCLRCCGLWVVAVAFFFVLQQELFKSGALQAAIAIAMNTTRFSLRTQAHATRFFFNCTATPAHRPLYKEQGAFALFKFIATRQDAAWAASLAGSSESHASAIVGYLVGRVRSHSQPSAHATCDNARVGMRMHDLLCGPPLPSDTVGGEGVGQPEL